MQWFLCVQMYHWDGQSCTSFFEKKFWNMLSCSKNIANVFSLSCPTQRYKCTVIEVIFYVVAFLKFCFCLLVDLFRCEWYSIDSTPVCCCCYTEIFSMNENSTGSYRRTKCTWVLNIKDALLFVHYLFCCVTLLLLFHSFHSEFHRFIDCIGTRWCFVFSFRLVLVLCQISNDTTIQHHLFLPLFCCAYKQNRKK